MKKLFLISCLIPVLLSACNSKCIEDSGIHKEHNTTVKNFDKIEVSGAIKLILRQDSSYAVKVATDSALMDYVKIEVSNSRLIVKLKEVSYCGKDSVVVEAGIGRLRELTASGAISTSAIGSVFADDLKLSLSGTSDLRMDLKAASLVTNLDGISKLNLSGQTGTHQLNIQGNADVEAFNFTVGIYKIQVTGNAKAKINVLNELDIKTEGASEIFYKGNPKKINEKKSGAATLEKVNL
ncbi:MAG TPA: head GIN domain-containing protein [Pedobacter sp.]|nr:head GIN domain-containing protein [Pedobacter sp.]